jgi:lipoprotein-anchoring transpeptidase ErfK/SrfK
MPPTKIGRQGRDHETAVRRTARKAGICGRGCHIGVGADAGRADVLVQIDKSSQRMAVSVDGMMRYDWPVSTGRSGYGTPSGVFHPQMMARRWFSRKYYNSPMPHAIFFHHGFAIHGTYELSRLGGPASHGCVRLHPSHAAVLFALVERNGSRNTRIEISN